MIISGIATFSIAVVSQSSSFLALQLDRVPALGPMDQVGKPVAVIAGTQTVPSVIGHSMRPVQVRSLEEGVRLLRDGKVNAVVHGSPLLKYYLKNNPDPVLDLALQTFELFTYGITFRRSAPGGRNSMPNSC